MNTDYEAHRFAERFARSRALTPVAHQRWVSELASATAGTSVSRVIDVGAGAGRFWPVFRDAWQPNCIVAVDRSRAMLLEGASGLDVHCIVADVDHLPLASEIGDVCFCSMVLHYSKQPVELLKRLRLTLRPAGVLIVRTGTSATLKSFDFLRFFPSALQAERAVMPEDEIVRSWLEASGFSDLEFSLVPSAGSRSRLTRWRRVRQRGFPSLQLVSRREFVWGSIRFALSLVWEALTGQRVSSEVALLVVARRT